MKTITTKNTFKLFMFLLILFSAKAISQYPKLPNDGAPTDCSSRIGTLKKATTVATTTSKVSQKAGNSK